MKGYSIRETAALIGVATSTFYLWMKSGAAPKVTKIGGRSIIFERDYLAWLDQQSSKAA